MSDARQGVSEAALKDGEEAGSLRRVSGASVNSNHCSLIYTFQFPFLATLKKHNMLLEPIIYVPFALPLPLGQNSDLTSTHRPVGPITFECDYTDVRWLHPRCPLYVLLRMWRETLCVVLLMFHTWSQNGPQAPIWIW